MALNEGQTVQYTVVTSRVADGTVLYWKTTGNTTNSDIVGGNTGSISVTNNQAVFNIAVLADVATDDTKTLGISLSTGSLSGPVVVSTSNPITVIDSSQAPAYKLYTIGAGSLGRLGTNDDIFRSSPTQVGSDTNWNEIAFGGQATLATKTNGTLWGWGDNSAGQLGTNNTVVYSSPVQIGTLTNWSKVSLGTYFAAAVKTDGTLWTWGSNGSGQLGQSINYLINKSSPTQVGSQTNWTKVACGSSHLLAAGTSYLYSCGQNIWGQLGINNISYRSSPVQVGSIFGVVDSLAAGPTNSFAIGISVGTKTLYSWGYNGEGYLGLSNRIHRSAPAQVGATDDFATVAFTSSHILATAPNGTLWGWGSNDYGQLGLNNVSAYGANRSYKVQIGTSTDWAKVSAGTNFSHAIKTNGTLWTWGRNMFGQGGTNDAVNRSSPTQVGSATNWNKISSGAFNTVLTTSS